MIKAIYKMRAGMSHPDDVKDAPEDPMTIRWLRKVSESVHSQDFSLFSLGSFMLAADLLIKNLLKLRVARFAGVHCQTFQTRLGRWRRCAHRRLHKVK